MCSIFGIPLGASGSSQIKATRLAPVGELRHPALPCSKTVLLTSIHIMLPPVIAEVVFIPPRSEAMTSDEAWKKRIFSATTTFHSQCQNVRTAIRYHGDIARVNFS